MRKNKEDAVRDFTEMITHAWTYHVLTDDERKRWVDVCEDAELYIGGSYKQRWDAMNFAWDAFLNGVGYSGPYWRKEMWK